MSDSILEELAHLGLPLDPGVAAETKAEPREADRLSRYVTGGSFLLDLPATPRAIWGRGTDVLWPAGEPLLITGPTNIGKTTLVGGLIRARIGLRSGLLGFPVQETGSRVLLVAADRARQAAYALSRGVTASDRALLDERLVVWPRRPDRDLPADPELLLRMCQEVEADTVVLDSLKDMAPNLVEESGGGGVNRAIQSALAEGVEVVSLHHQRKSQNGVRPRTVDDVYGSMHLTSGAGSIFLLWGTPGDLVVDFVHLKMPADEVGPLSICQDPTTGEFSVLAKPDPVAIISAGPPGGLSLADIARALFGVTGVVEDKVRKKTERLLLKRVASGEIVKEDPPARGGPGGTKPALYRLP